MIGISSLREDRSLRGRGPVLWPHRGRIAPAAVLALLASVAGGQDREIRLHFVGDTGTGGSNQGRVRDQMLRFPAPLVFLLGDNIYDRGERTKIATHFDEVYAPLMRRGARFHAALGNHDVQFCGSPLRDQLPADADAYHRSVFRCDVQHHLRHEAFGYLGQRRYYSVVTDASPQPLGEVFVLDSNTLRSSQSKLPPLMEDGAQLAWLDAALGRSRALWKIAVLHHPPHSPRSLKFFLFVPRGEGRAREVLLDRQISPILKRHRVDAVFAGHNHFYARMYPQDGIRYFVSGGGGRATYAFKDDPSYVAAGGDYYHFVHVRLSFGRFEYYVIDRDGAVRDAGWWQKGDGRDRSLPEGALPPPTP